MAHRRQSQEHSGAKRGLFSGVDVGGVSLEFQPVQAGDARQRAAQRPDLFEEILPAIDGRQKRRKRAEVSRVSL